MVVHKSVLMEAIIGQATTTNRQLSFIELLPIITSRFEFTELSKTIPQLEFFIEQTEVILQNKIGKQLQVERPGIMLYIQRMKTL